MGKACAPHEKGCPEHMCPACILVYEKEQIRDALRGLIEAHREVFRNSLFAGFRAGKSTFHKAWTEAEKYVPDTQVRKEK